MGKVYRSLGLSCKAATADEANQPANREAFQADITYVTGQRLCFTYLRDNTCLHPSEVALPPVLRYALVDEADSILLDESRNPMIMSQPAFDSGELVMKADRVRGGAWLSAA